MCRIRADLGKPTCTASTSGPAVPLSAEQQAQIETKRQLTLKATPAPASLPLVKSAPVTTALSGVPNVTAHKTPAAAAIAATPSARPVIDLAF